MTATILRACDIGLDEVDDLGILGGAADGLAESVELELLLDQPLQLHVLCDALREANIDGCDRVVSRG